MLAGSRISDSGLEIVDGNGRECLVYQLCFTMVELLDVV